MLFLAVLAAVAAEVAAFVVVGQQIGFGLDILLIVVISALGPFIVKRVGLGVLAQTRERVALGEVPTREVIGGVLVLVGGIMICIPGFIGDALGLLLMVAPVRRLLIRVTGLRLAKRVATIHTGRWQIIDARSRNVEARGGPADGQPDRQPDIPPRSVPPGGAGPGDDLPGGGRPASGGGTPS